MAMFVSGSSTSTGSFGTVKGTKHAIFGSHPDMDDMWYRTLSLGGRPNSSTLATLGFDPGGTYKQGIDYNSGDGELSFWGHNGSTFIKSVAFVGGASIGASTLVVSGSKVGIGVATPLAMLQVSPTSGASDTECIRLLNDTHQAYMSLWRGGNEVGRIATAYTELSLYAGNGGGIRLMDDGGNVGIYVKDGGKVGIGTTNPGGIATQSTLEIRATAAFLGLTSTAGSNSSGIEFGDTDDGNIGQIHYFHGDNSMNFTTNTGVAMTLDSSQNVGIGTTAPQIPTATSVKHKLQLSGSRFGIVGNGVNQDWFDAGGGSNDKWLNLNVDGGIAKFGVLHDDAGDWSANNILVMDMGTGNVGIGTTASFGGSATNKHLSVLNTDTSSINPSNKLPLAP